MYDDEISPEELFSRFFGGGGFGPFGKMKPKTDFMLFRG